MVGHALMELRQELGSVCVSLMNNKKKKKKDPHVPSASKDFGICAQANANETLEMECEPNSNAIPQWLTGN